MKPDQRSALMPAPTIGILPLSNFTLTAFSSLIDVLRLAADEGDRSRPVRLRWSVISPSLEPIKASCGVEIRPWETLGDPVRFDYIVVCGGLLRRRHGSDEIIEEFLHRARMAGVTLVSLCTGSFMLAQAGVLSGRRACVSWYHLSEFQEEFPDVDAVSTDLFVFDQDTLSSAGGTSAADVGAWIVERHCGKAVAHKALNILLIDSARPGGFPQPQPAMSGWVDDERVHKAILMLCERMDRTLPVPELAGAVGVSRRQLERLFIKETGQSPASFAAMIRLRYADWLMKTTTRSLTEIAAECGFADAAHLSRRYKVAFGRLPSEVRSGDASFLENERRPYRCD